MLEVGIMESVIFWLRKSADEIEKTPSCFQSKTSIWGLKLGYLAVWADVAYRNSYISLDISRALHTSWITIAGARPLRPSPWSPRLSRADALCSGSCERWSSWDNAKPLDDDPSRSEAGNVSDWDAGWTICSDHDDPRKSWSWTLVDGVDKWSMETGVASTYFRFLRWGAPDFDQH